MSENLTAPTSSEPDNSLQAKGNAETSSASNQNREIHRAIAVFSVIQIGCFFLPWVNILIGKLSGFNITQLESAQFQLVWLVPLAALASFLSGISKTGALFTAQMAGAMPFLALFYYIMKIGTDLFRILEFGAFATLFFGAVLFVLPRFLKQPQS